MQPKKPKSAPLTQAVPDPSALKALTHPERLRMLGLLRAEGPATATQLAKRLGLNTGSTSYHLRQLARHGFIDPAKELGDARDRWWRARHTSTYVETAGQTGEAFEVGMAFTQAIISEHAIQTQRALEEYRNLPPKWQRASTASDFLLNLDATRAEQLITQITELIEKTQRQLASSEDKSDEQSRPFSILLHSFPIPGAGSADEETSD